MSSTVDKSFDAWRDQQKIFITIFIAHQSYFFNQENHMHGINYRMSYDEKPLQDSLNPIVNVTNA